MTQRVVKALLVFVVVAGAYLMIDAIVKVVVLYAQDKPVAASAPAAPQYTEVEQLKLSNLALQAQNLQTQAALIQQAMRQVDTDRTALILSIEKEHPGWTINRETLKWEPVTPVPSPKK